MRVPERWLRAFVDPPITTEALADTLTMAGLEVEEAQSLAPAFSGVVVGRVLATAPHPDADRLRDRKSTRLNSSHRALSRMPSSA